MYIFITQACIYMYLRVSMFVCVHITFIFVNIYASIQVPNELQKLQYYLAAADQGLPVAAAAVAKMYLEAFFVQHDEKKGCA
jgi:hypothetical protein